MRKIVFATALLYSFGLQAEIKLPDASPAASVSQAVGLSNVTITYHRPGVKGRTIWGGLVPLDKVWRMGANEATTIELTHPAKIAGTEVAAGKYALFAIPGSKQWTIIIDKKPDQWGAFSYKQEEDVARIKVVPESAPMTERLEFTFDPKSDDRVDAVMRWEKIRVAIPIEFDTKNLVWKQIDKEVAAAKPTDWATFYAAAKYSMQTKERHAEGMHWLEQAWTAKDTFWNYELKARMLQQEGRTAEAMPLLAKAIELAKAEMPQEFIDGLLKTQAEWKK